MRRAGWFLVAAVLFVASGCGAVPATSTSDASSTRTASPIPSVSPNAFLAPGDCTGSSRSLNSTPMMARGTSGITLPMPNGWSDQTSQVTGESVLLRLQAPATYGSDKTSLMLLGLAGHWIGSSGLASLGPQSSVNDCTVGGEGASFYRYQDSAGNDVYRLLILHCPSTKYPPLYAVVISSQGQIDDQAAADVRGILGSWNWGGKVCDFYNN